MAHLAWFERTFVQRLKWLNHEELAGLIALCQALPGPASSQTAMAIGYHVRGWTGAFLAWIGFTLPSAFLMLAAAQGALILPESLRLNLVHGMKVAVVGVIAVALWKMGQSLLKTRAQFLAAAFWSGFFLIWMSPWTLLLAMALVLLLELRRQGRSGAPSAPGGIVRPGKLPPALLAIPGLWLGFLMLALFTAGSWPAIPLIFYQTGLLVFGGGHVVLPLLEGLVVDPGWVSQESFLLGYGLAQLIPGPIFSFAAYLGASFPGSSSGAGLLALVCIYLPSFLLLGWLLPGWHRHQASPLWKGLLRQLHPVVVGLLAATWVSPVLTSAIRNGWDALIAAGLTVLLAACPRCTLPALLLTAGLYLTLLA